MNTERFVYFVQTQDDYEGPSLIEAHLSEDAAQRKVDACNAYAELAPSCPDIDDSEELWAAFLKARDAWLAGHPLGADHVSSYLDQRYGVGKVRLAQGDGK